MIIIGPVAGRLFFYLRRRIAALVALTVLAALAVVVVVRAGLIDPARVEQLGIVLSAENGSAPDPARALAPWRWVLSWLVPIGAVGLAIGGPLVRDWPETPSFTLSLPPTRTAWTLTQVAVAVVTLTTVLSVATVGVVVVLGRLGVPPMDRHLVVWVITSVAIGSLVWAWFGALASVATGNAAMALLSALLLLAYCKLQSESLVAFAARWLTTDASGWGDGPSWEPAVSCLMVAGSTAFMTLVRVHRRRL